MTTMNAVSMGNGMTHAPAAAGPGPGTPGYRRAVFVITEKPTPEGPRTFWTRVGAAFDNRDGSVTIKLEALPLSGTLQVREDDRDRRNNQAATAPF